MKATRKNPPRTLRVYGWSGFRYDAPGTHRQTREIVAARSVAAVRRIIAADLGHPDSMRGVPGRDWIGETGNDLEIQAAMAEPGVVFWRGIDEPNTDAPFRRSMNAQEG